jgi:beta-1,4-mannosyl-glycoprotein beta-1,4-N-acetylglucosaminyltransferase
MLIDTFQFYNELDILELRFKTLDPYVNLFVISESPETHAGKPKPLFFEENKQRFAKWLPKIRHIIAPPCKTNGLWDREKHQRECLLEGIQDMPDDAFIMISDADEIPKMDKLMLQPETTRSFHMFMFEYSFDNMFVGESWIGTVVTNVREYKKMGPNYFRDNRWKFPCYPYSGWHCSSFGDAKHVWNKIQNYAHANDDKHKHQTFEDFEKYLKMGLHSDGISKLIKRPPEVPLP